MEASIEPIPTKVKPEMKDVIERLYQEKVFLALKNIQPGKSLGPESMNPFFFEKFMPTVGSDVCAASLAVLNGGPFA